jgi:predicted RNA-binding Zn-ribbon protein involved in translation (DUF1610 family)
MSELSHWAKSKKLERPFFALSSTDAKTRDLIRRTLHFEYPDAIVGNPEEEAKAILWKNRSGIVARIHNRWEQIWPWADSVSWMEILDRIVDGYFELQIHAHNTEEDLEKLIIRHLASRAVKGRGAITKTIDLPKIPSALKRTGFVLTILSAFDEVFEPLLKTSDGPAVKAAISICYLLQEHPYILEEEEEALIEVECPSCRQIIEDYLPEAMEFSCPTCGFEMFVEAGEIWYSEDAELRMTIECPGCSQIIEDSFAMVEEFACPSCGLDMCIEGGEPYYYHA